MNETPGIPFGDPRHPFKYESDVMRARGKKSKSASPWKNFVINPRKREASRQLRDPEPPKAA